ncbi:MAG: DUF4070 domain-containing protein [Syntrophobacterales bacterium]|jgi:radical SAM superfamily enzyme YgiQ (UPF0313 family)|nr:DUF4070 domain-containing protein [Syntrophobacterales bacterium]
MRVLLVNPEMPPSFWSFRESCKLLGRKTLLPPLGLLTVAALLPQEWEFRLVDLNTRNLSPADWQWADLVMITGMIIQREGVLNLIRQAKALGKTTVVGGPYVTSTPQEAQAAGANFVVRGEGETVIPQFLSALREGKAGGLIQEGSKPDMSISPVPRFDLLTLDDYVTMSIQTSRGCPFDCEFCDIVSLYGRKPRYKEPDQVIAELEVLYRLGWRRVVFVSDDNFIGNKKHARAILAPLTAWMKSHGEPFGFITQASVNLGHDVEMIDLLTDANFNHIFLGVETPEPEILSRNQKYQNLKEPLGPSLETIGANGLSMVASFIIGFDHEATGAGDRICDFVEKHHIPLVMLNLLQAPPQTRLWKRLQQEGRLLDLQTTGDSYGLDLNFIPTRAAAEIVGEYVDAIDRLYEPVAYLGRTYRFYLNMRPTRRALGQAPKSKTAPARPAQRFDSAWFKGTCSDWKALLTSIWRQGILAPHRRQYWRQLLGIYRQNPSRLKSYLAACVMGENLFPLRREILQKWRGM